jgi:hypothetical protein
LYLLENKLSPTKAVANVERWVKDNKNEDGESLKRELSWASDSAEETVA